MLKRCVSAEWIKLRHSHIWMILMILPVISVLIGSANFYLNQGVLSKEWYSLWSQVGLFYGEFFFPILIAILCSYLWRLEHLNKNWNMIMSAPVSKSSIFLSKLIVVSILLLFVQGLFCLLYLVGGYLNGFRTAPPKELLQWILQGWLAAMTISALQLALSMRIRSFAAPIGIGLCGVFVGLFLYVTHLGLLFPHSLLTMGMGVLSQTSLSMLEQIGFVVINVVYMVIIVINSLHRMRKIDVIA